MVLTAEDEQVLWWVLHRHATAPVAAEGSSDAGTNEDGGGSGGSEPSLNYDEFVQASCGRLIVHLHTVCTSSGG